MGAEDKWNKSKNVNKKNGTENTLREEIEDARTHQNNINTVKKLRKKNEEVKKYENS